MSLIGSLLFKQINRKIQKTFFFLSKKFFIEVPSFTVDSGHLFVMVKFQSVNIKQIIGTGILGFSLSLLMFLVSISD
jgi:hypothetical protein